MNLALLSFFLVLLSTVSNLFIFTIPPIIPFLSTCLLVLSIVFFRGLEDFRSGLLLITLLYSFLGVMHFLINGDHDLGQGGYNLFASLEDPFVNYLAIQYINFFLIGICLHSLVVKNSYLIIINDASINSKMYSFRDYRIKLFLAFCLFLFFSFSLDWQRILSEYTLEGISLTFFLSYYIFFIYSFYILQRGKLNLVSLIPLFFIIVIFFLTGTRQTIFWGILLLALSFYIFRLKENNEKDRKLKILNLKTIIKLSTLFFLILILFSGAVYFRVNRDPEMLLSFFSNLPLIFKLFINLFIAETMYTYYNLLIVLDLSLNGVFSLLNFFNDLILQIIPAQIFPEKYKFMDFNNLSLEKNLTPFGTWFSIGMFTTISFHPLLICFYSFLYCSFLNFLSLPLRKLTNNNPEYIAFYCVIYIFCSVYIVRATIAGGLKIAFSIIVIAFLINSIFKVFTGQFVEKARR
tara:strand:+ start:715 stop:2103 length:1389 start_codon:yes stop_codon:yes gene_type:complete